MTPTVRLKIKFVLEKISFFWLDEQIPVDFNPNQTCLFCLNRQEYFSIKKIHHNKTNVCVNEDTEPIINDEENSPLDLSLKSTSNLK